MDELTRDRTTDASSCSGIQSPITALVHDGAVAPSELLEVVLMRLRETELADQTMARVAETMTRFTAFLELGLGIHSVPDIGKDHVARFLFAPLQDPSGPRQPAIATMHLRRTALRLYFRIARQEA